MLSWTDLVQRYIIQHHNQIHKITAPLSTYFGIEYFTYHRIDLEGHYTVLVDKPDWAEHYVSNKFYMIDPFLRHPELFSSGACLMSAHGSKKYKETILKAGKKILGMDECLILINKTESYVEFFGFGGNSKNCDFTKIYLNHLPLLETFSHHFFQEMNPILSRQREEAHKLSESKGKDFFSSAPLDPFLSTDRQLNFLKAIGKEDECREAKCLSTRERECLKFLRAGKSIKETASVLMLSPRTVEHYLENIRIKLSCWNKGQLFEKAEEFHRLGLLSN